MIILKYFSSQVRSVRKCGGAIMSLKELSEIVRLNFLLLTPITIFVGMAAAIYDGYSFKLVDTLIALSGALLAHISVNSLNNYFDYRSGIDARTPKTPFSGGIRALIEGRAEPHTALFIGSATSALTLLIAIYFLIEIPLVFFIGLVGLALVVLYTPLLSKIPFTSEPSAGIGFGLMVLGMYAVEAGTVTGSAWPSFIIVSILVGLLLFINEFPDADADREAGRRHTVIMLGKDLASKIYAASVVLNYALIVLFSLADLLPTACLISLVSLPFGYRAAKGALKSKGKVPDIIPAMANNLLMVLTTITALGIGLLVGIFLK